MEIAVIGLHVIRFYLIFYFSNCVLVCPGGSEKGTWGLMEDKVQVTEQTKSSGAPGDIYKILSVKHHLPGTWPS